MIIIIGEFHFRRKSIYNGCRLGLFYESIKGSIEVGKMADFVILDQDLTKIDPNRLLDVQVIETWVDESKVYTRN